MAANVVGSLMLEVGANVARITSDLGKIQRQVSKFGNDVTRTFSVIQRTVGTAFSVGMIAAFAKEALDLGESISKASKKFGIGAEELSGLRYAAQLADVSFEDMGTALKKLSVSAVDATKGTGDAAAAFRAMGVRVTDSAGAIKPLDKLLGEVADKFAGYEDGAEKVAIATAIMGRNAAAMIPLLNEGSAGLSSMKDEAKKLGLVLTDETAKSMEEFNDNIKRMKEGALGLAVVVTNNLVAALRVLGQAFTVSSEGGAELFSFGGATGGVAGGAGGSFGEAQKKKKAPILGKDEKGKSQFTGIPDFDSWQLSLDLLTKRYEDLGNLMNLTEEDAAALSAAGIEAFRWSEQAKQAGEELKIITENQRGMMDLMADFSESGMADLMSTPDMFNAAVQAGNVEQAIAIWEEGFGALNLMQDEAAQKVQAYQELWMTANRSIESGLIDIGMALYDRVGATLASVVTGAAKASDAFKALGKSVIGWIAEMVAKWIMGRLAMLIFGESALAAETAASMAAGIATAVAWAPAAAAVSLASFGANSIPAMAGIASTYALTSALSIPALAEGGIVSNPTLVLAGEAGPEAIVPLDDDKGGRTIELHVDGEKWFEFIERGVRQGRLQLVPA